MDTSMLDMNKILDLKKWEIIQDEIADVTGMAIITVDYKGVPVTKHSRCSDFCKAIRNDKNAVKFCQKCDSRGGLEAVHLNSPYIYLCHCHIVDVAIPITVNEKYVGAVMAGQVLLDEENEDKLEKIMSNKQIMIESNTYMLRDYAKLPKFSLARIEKAANLLWHISNYIIQESLHKLSLMNLISQTQIAPKNDIASLNLVNDDFDLMFKIKKDISMAITSSSLKDTNVEKTFIVAPVLRPAIDYIHGNKHEFVSLKQMAKLCHLSPGYFSRLFKKEVGKNFSSYINLFKIDLAKQLLETTNASISQISDDLGYSDTGYFIKQFKKSEGITPALFRKYLY